MSPGRRHGDAGGQGRGRSAGRDRDGQRSSNTSPLDRRAILQRAAAQTGRPYRRREIQARLTDDRGRSAGRGYYEAQASLDETAADGVDLGDRRAGRPARRASRRAADSLPGSIDDADSDRTRSARPTRICSRTRRRDIERALKRQGYARCHGAVHDGSFRPDGQSLVVDFHDQPRRQVFRRSAGVAADLQLSPPWLREAIARQARERSSTRSASRPGLPR